MKKHNSKSSATEAATLVNRVKESNARIVGAITVLQNSEGGRIVLHQVREITTGVAQGLDSEGQRALLALVTEFCENDRRGFLPYHTEGIL